MSPYHLYLHLRLPFSLFLAPVALLGLLAAGPLDPWRTLWIMISLHVFLYSASNAFNSYYDKDEGPIGGLAVPPPVDKSLLVTSFIWEALGLICAWMASPWFFIAMGIYGIFSKLYSWDKTRLKSRPLAGLLGIVLGQGALTFLAVAWTAGPGPLSGSDFFRALTPQAWEGFAGSRYLLGSLVASLILWGVYPLTQVYQHEEDARRGDRSYSLWVGIRGTFQSSALAFLLAAPAFVVFLSSLGRGDVLWNWGVTALGMAPALGYFSFWARRVWNDPAAADFKSTMTMNLLASGGLNLALTALLVFYMK